MRLLPIDAEQVFPYRTQLGFDIVARLTTPSATALKVLLSAASPARSIFPLGVLGRLSTQAKLDGTICDGRRAVRNSRNAATGGLWSVLATIHAASRRPEPGCSIVET